MPPKNVWHDIFIQIINWDITAKSMVTLWIYELFTLSIKYHILIQIPLLAA
jgi:hypothetical protein